MLYVLLPPLGILAGILTTVAGMGGGMVVLMALALLTDPKTALVATAPAMLLGNVHRAYLFRSDIDRNVARAMVLGGLPGSIVGGLLLGAAPKRAVAWLMLSMTLLAVARSLHWFKWKPEARTMGPAAFGAGALAATSGGAGLLFAPLLLASGLTGVAYVATAAVTAVSMHIGRVVAYGATGLITLHTLALSAVLTAALLLGNRLGSTVRTWIKPQYGSRIEVGAVVVAALLSLVGVGR